MNQRNNLKVLFVVPLRTAATMNFISGSIMGFSERGHRVDVLVSDVCHPPFDVSGPNINVLYYKDSRTSLFRGLFPGLISRSFRCAENRKYDLIVGVSQIGLIIAGLLHKRYRIPYIFFNDELWFGTERGTALGNMYGLFLKTLERRANRNAIFTVTQDPVRGKFLSKINSISMSSLRFLPNSPPGKAEWKPSTYLHQKLGIPSQSRIILWPSTVRGGDGGLELAQQAVCWPSDLAMVFHMPSSKGSKFVRQICALNRKGRVYVSLDPLPIEKVEEVFRSASVGIVFYRDAGINNEFLGFASGRINSFLRYGVPCIANECVGLRWLQDSKAGVLVKNSLGVLNAVQLVLSHQEGFRDLCIQQFEKHLSFSKAFCSICEELERAAVR